MTARGERGQPIVLRRLIDQGTLARAVARAQASAAPADGGIERDLPVFDDQGRRVGLAHLLTLDWSDWPREYLEAPGAILVLNQALDALPPADRAALLVDSGEVRLADVALALDEPVAVVRRRRHRARIFVRERLTAYFAAATAPD